MFDLFKEKLSIEKHKDIINYLISEEAVQQWNFHVVENNFEKEKFRGLPFAKNTLNLFIKNYLKMKVDDELLSLIADLGYRRCREYLDEYFALEKKIKKIKYEDLVKKLRILVYFTNEFLVRGRYKELKFDHHRFMSDGMGHVNFELRNKTYNIAMHIQREMQCYMRIATTNTKFAKMSRAEVN